MFSAEDVLFDEKDVSSIQSSANQLAMESPASLRECEWPSEVIDTNTDGKEPRDIPDISLESSRVPRVTTKVFLL